MDDGYLISEADLRRITKVVRNEERKSKTEPTKRRRDRTPSTFHSALAKTTSTISARSGTTPGSGTATVWERNASGVLEAVEFTDLVGMTIYNAATATVATDKYAVINRDRKGDWWVVKVFELDACDSFWAGISTATPTSSDHALFVQNSSGCLKRSAMGAC